MTSTDYPAVKNVFEVLKNTYNALDLRALIIKEGQNSVCLFCIIRATIHDDKFVKSVHDDKRSKIKFKEPTGCKIAFESKKINGMDTIFREMKNGYITIDGLKCQIKNPFHKDFTDASMKKEDSSNVIYENDKGFLHVGYTMIDEESRKSTLKILRDRGYGPGDFGFDNLREIESLYDTDYISNPINFVLSYPIYCNIDEFCFEGGKWAIAILRIHETIYSYCEIVKEIRSKNENLLERDTVTPVKKESHKGFLILKFSIDIPQLTENQSAIIKVKHTSLGIIGYSSLVERDPVPTLESISVNKILTESKLFPKLQFKIDDKLCFVLMPFDDKYNSIYDQVIKPAAKEFGLEAKRADDIFNTKPIIEDIWEYINKAKLIIANLSGKNPNVFYEVGLSHAIPKEVILITDDMHDVPFDLRHLRCIPYEDNEEGAVKLKQTLKKTIETLLQE